MIESARSGRVRRACRRRGDGRDGAGASQAGWRLTILPRFGGGTLMGAAARAHDPGFRTVTVGAYDG